MCLPHVWMVTAERGRRGMERRGGIAQKH